MTGYYYQLEKPSLSYSTPSGYVAIQDQQHQHYQQHEQKPPTTWSPYNSNASVVQMPLQAHGAQYGGAAPSGVPVVTMQPGASNEMRFGAGMPRDGNGERKWKNGLFECGSDCGHFCVSLWCPCLTYNQNMTRQRALENINQPHPAGGEYLGADCAIWSGIQCVTGCCGPALQISSRGKLRKRYGIRGGFLGDFMAALCCYACELTQSSQELAEEERFVRQQGFTQ